MLRSGILIELIRYNCHIRAVLQNVQISPVHVLCNTCSFITATEDVISGRIGLQHFLCGDYTQFITIAPNKTVDGRILHCIVIANNNNASLVSNFDYFLCGLVVVWLKDDSFYALHNNTFGLFNLCFTITLSTLHNRSISELLCFFFERRSIRRKKTLALKMNQQHSDLLFLLSTAAVPLHRRILLVSSTPNHEAKRQ